MKLNEILKGIKYSIAAGNDNIEVGKLETDSRKIEKGDVFIALTGLGADGHNFIRAAVENAPEYRKGAPEILEANDLCEAVALCRKAAQPGDIVTLSPACAAFDQFKNFAVRGRAYKELVGSLT